ncbi:MAG: c-type cytochrome, partial [Pirellulales bacterium]
RHTHVRQAGVALSSKFANDPSILKMLATLSTASTPAIRMQVALALGAFDAQPNQSSENESSTNQTSSVVAESLANILSIDQDDPWLTTALLTSTRNNSLRTLERTVERINRGDIQAKTQVTRFIRELSASVGAAGDIVQLEKLLTTLTRPTTKDLSWWRYSALSGLSSGLPRHKNKQIPNSLSGLLANPPAELALVAKSIQSQLETASTIALNVSAAEPDRLSAIELIASLPKEKWDRIAEQLMSKDQSAPIQLTVLQQMRRMSNPQNAALVISRWGELGPLVRQDSIGFLLQRKDSTGLTLQAMKAGDVSPAIVNIDQRAVLLAHADADIKQLARSIFGSGISPDREAVAKQYQAALRLDGNSESGKAVFEKVCAACHRFNGVGNEVGPDISDTRNRSREALLYDILDPNQKLEPKYTAYQVVTVDGSAYQGLLQSESVESIVLQLAEAKQVNLARGEIEQLRASGKSLMPEGVEKEISVQQMADLLQFLKQ